MAQNYQDLVKAGGQLYKTGNFKESVREFTDAFQQFPDAIAATDFYNCACVYALLGNPDSAFYFLFQAVNTKNYSNYKNLIIDNDLISLHNDGRWQQLTKQMKDYRLENKKTLDRPLVEMLDTIFYDDQVDRKEWDRLQQQEPGSPKLDTLESMIRFRDSINVLKISKLLDQHGWLGYDIIGRDGVQTVFLVIQHADLAIQEKYLPMIELAVEKNELDRNLFALLKDRTLLRTGNKQLYGTQIDYNDKLNIYYVAP